jgi:Acetyltransferase (GNAT) domain
MAEEATFDLFPAVREDIPRLSHIHVVACLPDNAFKIYFDEPSEFDKRVTEMLEGQLGTPKWKHIKAVDRQTGQVAAWASWNTPTDEEIQQRDKEQAENDAKKQTLQGSDFDFPPGLPVLVQQDTDKWLNHWTRSRRHITCKALFTCPSFQRRGMGNALVQYGNKLADEVGLPIFLQASPYGFPIYQKHGFETVQYLDVDLRKWAPKAESNDKGYGNYRFRYMLRLPETLPNSADCSLF